MISRLEHSSNSIRPCKPKVADLFLSMAINCISTASRSIWLWFIILVRMRPSHNFNMAIDTRLVPSCTRISLRFVTNNQITQSIQSSQSLDKISLPKSATDYQRKVEPSANYPLLISDILNSRHFNDLFSINTPSRLPNMSVDSYCRSYMCLLGQIINRCVKIFILAVVMSALWCRLLYRLYAIASAIFPRPSRDLSCPEDLAVRNWSFSYCLLVSVFDARSLSKSRRRWLNFSFFESFRVSIPSWTCPAQSHFSNGMIANWTYY